MFPYQKKHYFCEVGRVYNALTLIKKNIIKPLKNKYIESKHTQHQHLAVGVSPCSKKA